MPKKPGLIDKAKQIISPTPTPAQAREKEMLTKWGLKKDPRVPHRYWIDDTRTITINMGDEESVAAADVQLAAFFRAPTIEQVSPETSAAHSPYSKHGGKKEGVMAQIDSALSDSGFIDLAKRAKGAEKDMMSSDFGFDPDKASRQMLSTDGMPDYSPRPEKQPSKKKQKQRPPKKKEDDFGLNFDQEIL